jgi:hypothetical protein
MEKPTARTIDDRVIEIVMNLLTMNCDPRTLIAIPMIPPETLSMDDSIRN